MDNQLFIDYLNSLYQNTRTAIQSIEDVTPKIDNDEIKEELLKQQAEYSVVSKECELIANKEDINIKDNTFLEKARLWTATKMNTMMDNSTRHIAEMFLLGLHMGLIQCLENKKDYQLVSEKLDSLCDKLVNLYEKFYGRMREFI